VHRVFERPKLTYVVLVVAIVGFFALSAVGNTGTDAQNKSSSVGWIGSLGWTMFLVSILATIVYSAVLLVRARRRRRVSAS
jgi:uncharacterized membrane protein